MSVVTTVVVVVGGDLDDKLMSKVLAFDEHNGELHLVKMDRDTAGGGKLPHSDVWWGGFNHFDVEGFFDYLEALVAPEPPTFTTLTVVCSTSIDLDSVRIWSYEPEYRSSGAGWDSGPGKPFRRSWQPSTTEAVPTEGTD